MRRPSVQDLGIVVALVATMLGELAWRGGDDTRVTPAAVAVVVLVALPTLARRRHPGWALTGCMVALYVALVVVDVHNTAPFGAMLCGYQLALTTDRRRTALATAVLVPAVVTAVFVFNPQHDLELGEQLKNLAFVFFPVVAARAIRNRRAYEAALLDRAETAERTREEEAARRVSEERLRIAQDVHDVVAHAMVAINVQAGVGLHLLGQDPDRARQALTDIKQASGEALHDLRSTLGVLRAEEAPVAPTLGLDQLGDLVAGLRSAGVAVQLEVDPSALTVPAGVATTGYRIVQEALTNVVRHAGGGTVRVGVSRRDGAVVIEVDDAGPGVDGPAAARPPAPPGGGHGVPGMQERAAAAGGTLEAGPYGEGWRVRAVLPAVAT